MFIRDYITSHPVAPTGCHFVEQEECDVETERDLSDLCASVGQPDGQTKPQLESATRYHFVSHVQTHWRLFQYQRTVPSNPTARLQDRFGLYQHPGHATKTLARELRIEREEKKKSPTE